MNEPDLLPTEFYVDFVHESRPERLKQFLGDHPEVLVEPLTYFFEAFFVQAMDQARADLELVELRDLILRRWVLRRSRTVGVDVAFAELAESPRWQEAPEWERVASN
jgi:hypothetical protein